MPRPAALPILLSLLALALGACQGCPPGWLAQPPAERDWLYASGSCGEVHVEADARDVALVRAARRLADRLGLDAEPRLSVSYVDGRVWVELLGADGPSDALDAMELVETVRCDGVTHVLVRVPAA